jgi:TonB family protein
MKILIEIAAIQIILYGIYYLWLRRETDFTWRRFFLLGLVVISLLTPFIHLPTPPRVAEAGDTYLSSLPAIKIAPDTTPAVHDPSWQNIIVSITWLGSGVLLLIILISVIQIIRYQRTATPRLFGRLWIWLHPKVKESFSFFSWIFSQDLQPSIIAHEAAHVRLRHSYDVMLLQINRALFWWNPISWQILREMIQVHEYQADQLVLKENNIDEYQQLLINSTLSSMGWGLASSFHSGSLLKRIHAMKQQTRKINRWKISSLGALVAIIALVFACEELDQDIKKMSEDSRQISFEELPKKMQEVYFEGEDKFTFMIVYLDDDEVSNAKAKIAKLNNIDPNLIETFSVQLGENRRKEAYVVLRKNTSTYEYVEQQAKISDDVFTIVEEAPTFPGGMTAFYDYVAEHLTYPQQAKKLGIEGRVFVEFIVDEEGNVTNSETVKGIGVGCDSVAAAVVAAAPRFNPGKQKGIPVKVRMVLPVVFSLNENKPKEDIDNQEEGSDITLTIEKSTDEKSDIVFADGKEIIELKPDNEYDTSSSLFELNKETELSNLPINKEGMIAFNQFVSEHMLYPEKAKKKGIEGRVFVQFTISIDGTIKDATVVKGLDEECDREALRVISELPKFDIKTQGEKAQEARMILPVEFKLD